MTSPLHKRMILCISVFSFLLLIKTIRWSLQDNQDTKKPGGSKFIPPTLEDNETTLINASDSHQYVVFCGTRPEIIKTAPVVIALKKANLKVHVVFTGQHPDIAAPFREFWDIQFDTVLDGVFQREQTLPSLAGNLLKQIEQTLPPSKLDVWIVQGDTSTVFCASTVAFLRGTPLIHLEAGLRTFDNSAPFPEEYHRRSTALATALHVAPTALAQQRLIHEGVDPKRIVVLGNSGMDATRLAQPHLRPPPEVAGLKTRLVLVTLHRRENAHHLSDLYEVMGKIKPKNITFVVLVHPNPAATKAAKTACSLYRHFLCVSPLGYAQTHWLMKHGILVVTDSGGLQEEATWYGRPLLVLRTATERPEGIDSGSTILVPDATALGSVLPPLIEEPNAPGLRAMEVLSLPYGDGHTSDLLVKLLQKNSTQKLLTEPIRMIPPIGDRAGNLDLLPPCSQVEVWRECHEDASTSIDLVLTVYKRTPSLRIQLDAMSKQTLRPNRVWIFQNENHVDVPGIVDTWRNEKGGDIAAIPIDIVTSSSNTRYHVRFHFAYAMSNATYISIWDDDILPGSDWLKYNIEFSKSHNDSLVGGNGRVFHRMYPERHCLDQKGQGRNGPGRVDFVGHSWTLRREFLRFYLGAPVLTYATGEDIQLSFALQRHGIASYIFPQSGQRKVVDLPAAVDENASFLTPQQPRHWLFCKVLEQGFQPLECENCTPENVKACLSNFSDYADAPFMSTKLQGCY
eukprot:GHVN01070046.1.p1 GENE.GHVN01070046.1~~GHVN01070046.1.p1  ORF type:complete len:739 (+),score=19.01 GHVN01070046.1:676-2892(+)